MKMFAQVFVAAISLLLTQSTLLLAQTTPATETLSSHAGKYFGFSPTDESAVKFGEAEMTISDKEIVIRMATGLKIETETIGTGDFVLMTREEVASEYRPDATILPRVVGFRRGNLRLLLIKDVKGDEGPGLIVRTGSMSEMLGPTVFFNPTQVAGGEFDKTVQALEHEAGKGVLPRLRNKGKAEK